ncbi:pyridoxamine 5'-phosphate oxidase family protein [Nocardia mangyaensis]|uniref:pyridoxamine 5'-phosphate oxidase family protein n=1 Tax=Nocardia mangyaensis TaxID=2213200 RepID=UPI0026749CF8|nr:pyridoxamine 5'-phosphate oxidase family protein [Nocardia mangyaensis]MDO3646997.1 pyridoxamine 5'-phosphate oxidase family protein [Nocardia mangyaensis]
MSARTRAQVHTFVDIKPDFDAIVGSINYATMTTVDAVGRPRSRVLIPVWETDIDEPVGWLGTYRTPVKEAHIAGNPHVTFSYWSPAQNTVAVDTVAAWTDDLDTRVHVWDLYRHGSPPGAGYDPGQFWRGPEDPEFQVLRLEPWRVQVLRRRDLVSGVPARIWRAARRGD